MDYKETISLLHNLWDETRYEAPVAVADLGSKMQHLGIALYCRIHKETSVWLSEPLEFVGSRFSEGVGPMFHLDLGSTRDLRRLLDSFGSYEWKKTTV